MRTAGAHLGSVRRQPTDFQAFTHAHLSEQLAQQQHALSTEACDLDSEFLVVMLMLAATADAGIVLRREFQYLGNGVLRGSIAGNGIVLAITKHIQREVGNHHFAHPAASFDWVFAPNGRARGKNLYERKARPIAL